MARLAGPITFALSFVAVAMSACATPADQASGLTLETVGTRADLVSGGDVLLRVRGADPEAMIAINGAPVTGGLRPTADGHLALVEGLRDGSNTVAVTSGGRTARLTVNNHPNGGPLFSGPQIQPWPCAEGAADAQCNRPAVYSYSYMPRGEDAEFADYDPASPPADVATITTDQGVSVPYIVRIETLTQNRSGVKVATLYDPAKPWTAYEPQPQWNRGVYVLQGSGCGTGYGEREAGSPLNDRALSRGFMVVSVALLHNTINCNPVVQAEAALMAKEHVAETYGPFDIVFGQGSSGGAISQLMDQNAYPGLYDGLILNHLFADSDASRTNAYDCRVINDAWSRPGAPAWSDAQKSAVIGMLSGCASAPTRFQIYDASIGTGCNVPDEAKYDARTNPEGVRCTLQDYQVNQVGRRSDGPAFGRLDNEGVQYGLAAVLAGDISVDQFIDLNTAIGGHDIDFKPTPTRTTTDRMGLSRLYRSGLNNTLNNLSDTAIIETRLFVTDFHQPFHADMVQARLTRAQGHTDNYALWRTTTAREAAFDASFDVMVEWLRAIKADGRDVSRAQKVLDNRPALARDRCVIQGADQPLSACPRPPELARVLVGAPDTNDLGKCQLKALNRGDYPGVQFTAPQWAALVSAFPTGVCDYARPMVEFRMSEPWLSYSGDGRAEPLGPPPTSR